MFGGVLLLVGVLLILFDFYAAMSLYAMYAISNGDIFGGPLGASALDILLMIASFCVGLLLFRYGFLLIRRNKNIG